MLKTFIFLLVIGLALAKDKIDYDVTILGFGPQGASFAQSFIRKFPSSNILVLEKDTRIGGNANQVNNPGGPPGFETTEIGVVAYEVTDITNQNFGPVYQINSVEFANSVLPGSAFIVPATTSNNPTYIFDFNNTNKSGYGLQTPTPEGQQAFVEALETFFALIFQYPFLSDVKNIPNPVPGSLLQPFAQTILQNNLFPLLPIFAQSMVGVNDYINVSTLTALEEFPMPLIPIFTQPNSYFVLAEGSQTFYQKIKSNVEANPRNKVVLGAMVTSIKRPDCEKVEKGDIKLTYEVSGGRAGKSKYSITTKKLVITFPVTLSSVSFLDLDRKEVDTLSGYTVSNVWAFSAQVSGSIISGGFSIYNFNFESQATLGIPVKPYIKFLNRALPFGLANGVMASDYPMSIDQAQTFINTQLSHLPNNIITANVVDIFPHLNYHPRLEGQELANHANKYQQFVDLNNYRDTIWLGTTRTHSPGSVLAWDLSNRTVEAWSSFL